MTLLNNGLVEPLQPVLPVQPSRAARAADRNHPARHGKDVEFLRGCAWEIGEKRLADSYTPSVNHVGLAMVSPSEGLAHWRLRPEWVDQTARSRGGAWHGSRMVLRLYDISFIHFDGLNAHSLHDHPLPSLCGHLFFKLPRPGTWQLAEVGFLLQSGEFLPAARSQAVAFPPDAPSPHGGHAALLVESPGCVEPVDNVWEQDRILAERRRPRLRSLRIAALSLASLPSGQDGALAWFVSELAAGQGAHGHEVHVFTPASDALPEDRQVNGVHYHPVGVELNGHPRKSAQAFDRAVQERLREFAPFDLVHLHEWMTALGPRRDSCPAVLSLGSIEATRRNGTPPSPLSVDIEAAEREAARTADRILTPPWLRDRVVAELDVDGGRVEGFPMEGRMPNEWECPLDYGQVKMGSGVGPLDRLFLYVGPLDPGAGVDLLVEALPVLLQRCPNLRLAYVGMGQLHGALQHRAGQLGVAHAVRLLGHVEGPPLTRLLRAAEALLLPSRYRIPLDDAVVDLARRAGRPVVTTHGGPAHLVRHEETGLVTYDNPGSMVWAVDRLLGDPAHAERMGQNGRRSESGAVVWAEVARHYLELCAGWFPELTETRFP
jgi:glycosyltransferase involved in cell wall biosynthesis